MLACSVLLAAACGSDPDSLMDAGAADAMADSTMALDSEAPDRGGLADASRDGEPGDSGSDDGATDAGPADGGPADVGPADSGPVDMGPREEPPEITFYTNFETDQWGPDGEREPPGNFWEVDHGLPRTTDHPESPLRVGRGGSGRALWLGSYNNDSTRNEVGKDNALSFEEHWMGVSVNIQVPLDRSRIIIQNRLLADGSSRTVNAISLRQGSEPGRLYFSLPTDVDSVDTRPTNGAGSNTESVFFDYTEGEWIDIVLHYRGAFGADYDGPDTSRFERTVGFDPRSDGFIEIWVNGEQIVDHVGTTAYRYAREGEEVTGIITPKIGPYWSSGNDPLGDVFYDNYRLWVGPGGSYADLDPSR
ncbi:MAG: heparin lyase I family protein [Myxococcota bacterium]